MANPETDYGMIVRDIRRLVKMLDGIADELGEENTGNRAERYVAMNVRGQLREMLTTMDVLPKR